MHDVLQRLKQRKIVQWAIAYVAGAWALLQVLDLVAQEFGWPGTVMRIITVVLGIGFFVVLVLAWYHGERGAQRVGGIELLMLAALLVIAAVAVSWVRYRHNPTPAVAAAASRTAHGSATARQTMRAPVPSATTSSAATTITARPIPAKSVAVLPFTNESGQKSEQFFSDGLSEDLITALSQFAGLKVISRDSAFQFRDSRDSSAEIGEKLGVAHLLEGSVQRVGDEVRITATLVNAAGGSVLWSQRYDKPYKNLFALQDAITKAVASALQAKLLTAPGAVTQSDRPPSGNLAAYAAYLQATSNVAADTVQNHRATALADLRKAIRLDPHYALAYARLSEWWAMTYRAAHTQTNGPRDVAQARAAIKTALTLDPDLAAAHVAHGFLLYTMDFDWYGAQAEYQRALQLAPNDAAAKSGLAVVLATLGHNRAAIALWRERLKVDPRDAHGWKVLGNTLVARGQFDAAERAIHKGIALAPKAIWTYERLAVVAVLRGNARQAMAFAREEPLPSWRRFGIAIAAQIGHDRTAADAALQNVIAHDADTSAYQIAEIYALRRDPDNLFKWLDRAWTQRDTGIEELLSDPFILRYRHDPRFVAFCKKVGLPTTTDAVAMK